MDNNLTKKPLINLAGILKPCKETDHGSLMQVIGAGKKKVDIAYQFATFWKSIEVIDMGFHKFKNYIKYSFLRLFSPFILYELINFYYFKKLVSYFYVYDELKINMIVLIIIAITIEVIYLFLTKNDAYTIYKKGNLVVDFLRYFEPGEPEKSGHWMSQKLILNSLAELTGNVYSEKQFRANLDTGIFLFTKKIDDKIYHCLKIVE